MFGSPEPWSVLGPDGGDARSLAANPSNPKQLYLGTANSWIYRSEDGGSSWTRLAKMVATSDFILDNVVVDESDPNTIVVGAHTVDREGGGMFVSHDSGASWTPIEDMTGQSVRAVEQAASNPKLWLAGTIKGVYRSEDGGEHWAIVSPRGSSEIHEVESVAIDPKNTDIIYAGTWHLPWKSVDGGKNWRSIKQGLIDDSDVFSMIIDRDQPSIVYLSACSGIYKSENGGEEFKKIQGIPTTARRTRVLMQDPIHRDTVYAGTTEGLYKTFDAGKTFQRMTGPDVIVNDVYVDPTNPKHVLIATDRGGVQASEDATVSMQPSNHGFSQRQVATLVVDAKTASTLYAGVVNDKGYGGVFVSTDNGGTWTQRSNGLQSNDVFSLAQDSSGTLFAGTGHGIYRWDGAAWTPSGKVVKFKEVVVRKTAAHTPPRKPAPEKPPVQIPDGVIDSRVNRLDISGSTWYAATSDGVYSSSVQGTFWEKAPLEKGRSFRAVAATSDTVIAAERTGIMISEDRGKTWHTGALPPSLTVIESLAATPGGTFWMGGREGLFFSSDKGGSWTALATLPLADINGLSYDAELKRVIATSSRSSEVFAISEEDKAWKYWNSGWNIHDVHAAGGHLVGASVYDGVVMQSQPDGIASIAAH
jgi:photosystem II stability/assembly factor-like uncharacterized protein